MQQNNLLNRVILFTPYLFLAIVCIANISWNIADHDDGHTLGYHAMGRNPDIQRAYGAYDSMCDYLLSFLPVNYKVLLGCMVATTILASFFIIYFAGKILEQLFGLARVHVACALVLFLLAMPEFLYMIFSFKSVYISLAFILGAFSYILKKPASIKHMIVSALVFGLGVSFRWNMLMMGLPVAVVLFIVYNKSLPVFKSFLNICLWGLLALGSTLLFIYISGYSPLGIYNTYLWGKEYADKADFQLLAHIGNFSLFFTPATAFLFSLAAIYLFRNKPDATLFLSLFISSVLAVAVISLTPSFKFLAPVWLAFIALFGLAVKQVSRFSLNTQKILIAIIALLVAFNWLIGVQILTRSSNWGPGLEVKDEVEELSVFNKNLDTDNRFKAENVKIGFHDGLCLPTSEGMRPLYGHFYCLFAGKLNKLDEKLNRESDLVLERAKNSNTIIYQDRINPYLLASYLRKNYTTHSPWNNRDTFVSRTLTNGPDRVNELRVRLPANLFNIGAFTRQTHHYDSIYLMFTFTSSANKFLYQLSKDSLYGYKKIGPMSAVIWKKEN